MGGTRGDFWGSGRRWRTEKENLSNLVSFLQKQRFFMTVFHKIKCNVIKRICIFKAFL